MPRLQRREAYRRISDLTQLDLAIRHHLETGSTNFDGLSWPRIVAVTRAQFDAAWATFGEQITDEWIAKFPGSRPFGWWLDYGHERPLIDDAYPACRFEKFAHTFGFLHEEAGFGQRGLQEPQRDYLARHGILTAAELESVAAECGTIG